MREYREPENRDVMSYGKPSVSAWIAVAAVAFSFIVLGGFVHTYRQLEQLRNESRREIDKLRQTTGRLQSQLDSARLSQRRAGNGAAPAPSAMRRREREPEDAYDGAYPMPERLDGPGRSPGNGWNSDIGVLLAGERTEPEPGRVKARFGRRSADEGLEPMWEGDPCRVVSVDMEQKRLIIDGGRDRMLREGMGVELSRGQSYIAEARILAVHANQSVCEIGVARSDPAPDDLVRIPRADGGFGGR